MENDNYSSPNRSGGRHLSPKDAKAQSGSHSGSGIKRTASRQRSDSEPKKVRRSSKKEKLPLLIAAGGGVIVILLLCLIIFVSKNSGNKTPAVVSTPVITAAPVGTVNSQPDTTAANTTSGTQGDTQQPGIVEQAATPEPTATPAPVAKVNWVVGDTVKLGSYKQDKDGNSAALEWTVVSRSGNYALLVSNKIVKFMKMYSTTESTWEDSYVRDWLNNSEKGFGQLYTKGKSFMGTAFTSEEKAALVAQCDAPGSNEASQDKVFILSLAETKEYLSLLGSGCYPTEYAVLEGQRIGLGKLQNDTARWWWLRTTDAEQHFRFVNDTGAIDERVRDADNDYGGIRPAVWVDLTKVPA